MLLHACDCGQVLSHFAPWFEMSCGKHLNANPHSSALSEDARREILRQNAAEVAAYKEPRSPPSTLLLPVCVFNYEAARKRSRVSNNVDADAGPPGLWWVEWPHRIFRRRD